MYDFDELKKYFEKYFPPSVARFFALVLLPAFIIINVVTKIVESLGSTYSIVKKTTTEAEKIRREAEKIQREAEKIKADTEVELRKQRIEEEKWNLERITLKEKTHRLQEKSLKEE
ncbi:hypothetical protein [Candidatus Thiosymbion oneisti]|uniref:hypothetical protein n=1 Tax=Candidatus Thiosymbion oneisti TaxID=589554 RepID=UPI000B7DB41B|nr:hypothetical protein [Candidatus Thiosymbion oneisti]